MTADTLPTGTVTFLFSDIEGSTSLLRRDPDGYADLLADHHRIVRDAFAGTGVEVGTEGDSFLVAFSRPSDALHAALRAQLTLQHHAWPAARPVRVRMGIHTGEATVVGGVYVGMSLHLGARIGAAAHGEQIVLSQASADLVRDALPDDAEITGLGRHHLKDFPRPVELFQLSHPELPTGFPPLRAQAETKHNLPTQTTTFVGRETEAAQVVRLLEDERLVTLTGVGGSGKTRLALRVAESCLDRFADGAWLVELAAVVDADLVPQAVSHALGTRQREPEGSPLEALASSLGQQELLCILDNCEHLIGACAELVEALLRSCPKVRVLATSREALGIPSEVIRQVPSMRVPAPGIPASEEYEAVSLFCDRARRVRDGFRITPENAVDVAEICRRLDGMPLAIELAAGRSRSMTIQELRQRLDDRFRVLTGGSRTALPRQQTLQALIDWSYELLAPDERALLLRLTPFVGGFTLQAAEQVCPGDSLTEPAVLDLLESLVNKSMVNLDPESGRYGMLETIRQYAREKLLSATSREQLETLRRRHRDHYLAFTEHAEGHLVGPEAHRWIEIVTDDLDNIRVAVQWSIDEGHVDQALRILVASVFVWLNEHGSEAFHLFGHALALGGGDDLRAQALSWTGFLGALRRYEPTATRTYIDEAIALAQHAGDPRAEGIALLALGILTAHGEGSAAARSTHEQALERGEQTGDVLILSGALNDLAIEALERGDHEHARDLWRRCLGIARASGFLWSESRAVGNLGILAMREGDLRTALLLSEEGLARARASGELLMITSSMLRLAHLHWQLGDREQADAMLEDAIPLAQRTDASMVVTILNWKGWLLYLRGETDAAVAALSEAVARQQASEQPDRAVRAAWEHSLGEALRAAGDLDRAQPHLERALDAARDAGGGSHIEYLASLAATNVERGQVEVARRLAIEALEVEQVWDPPDPSAVAPVLLLETAALLLPSSRGHDAGRLIGAAEVLRHRLRFADVVGVRPARAMLNDPSLEGARTDGGRLPLEDARRLALRLLDDADNPQETEP